MGTDHILSLLLEDIQYIQRTISHHWLTGYLRNVPLSVTELGGRGWDVPYPVSGGWGDVDGQHPPELLDLHGEQQGRVGHLLHLLLDELRLRSLLEVLGLGDLVHETHDLARLVAPQVSAEKGKGGFRRGLAFAELQSTRAGALTR